MIEDIAETEPFAPFARWFAAAAAAERDAEAVILATVGRDGMPAARAVLLKGVDADGFIFYTNLASRKAGELRDNPQAALCFLWKSLRRQVRIEGRVAIVADALADAYFASRSRDSQIGAWASDQSQPLAERAELERRVAAAAARFAGAASVPRPDDWSGYRLVPRRVEFWQEQPSRLHDRLVFMREGAGWRRQLLFP